MKLRNKILLNILLGMVFIVGTIIINDISNIKTELNDIQETLQINKSDAINIYDIIKIIKNDIKDTNDKIRETDKLLYDTFQITEQDFMFLNNKCDNLIKEEAINKANLEYNLRKSVVIIYNKTFAAMGSGVIIKYKNNFYILSAGHMINTRDDVLTYGEYGVEYGELKILKHDFTTPEEGNMGDFTKGKDLILLTPKNKKFAPIFYVELAEEELDAPGEIYVVGNPAGIEDVVSDGRIIKHKNNFTYYIDHTYYGNSGGGIFTRDGKLIGIVSHMYPISHDPQIPPYMIYGAVRLNIVLEFLKDVR